MYCLPECIALLNVTLCDEWHTVIVLRAALPNAMPMNGHLHAFHVVFNIDDNLIVFADLYAGTGNHAIGCQDATLHTIGQDTLTMTPDGVGGVWCAHLTGAAREE